MPARAPTLNRRHATSVREKIKATQILNRLYDGFTGKVELSPTQAKVGMYLLSQAIGNPPQEIKGEVNINVRAQVQSIVARVGEERARMALEVLAPGLLTFLPSPETVDAEIVE